MTSNFIRIHLVVEMAEIYMNSNDWSGQCCEPPSASNT